MNVNENGTASGNSVSDKGFMTYIVTSCKGGIGKSTVSANIAMSCASAGHHVLLIDCDFTNRSLDLILGCEDEVVYDIYDAASGRARPEAAVITDRRCDRLFFVPAPLFSRGEINSVQLSAAVEKAALAYGCDTVFIDTPGASDDTVSLVAPVADAALIVASHHPTSVRGAEKTGMNLAALGIEDQFLIINKYDSASVSSGERPGLNELIDRTHIRLIGVIPDSEELELYQEKGKLAYEIKRDPEGVSAAFDETARRLCGERVPLMSFMPAKKRKKILNT